MNWAKMAFGNIVDTKKIFFVPVALERNSLL